ncbi:hypothetical protein [Chryseobacterium sp. JUb7]|uniref:hypothetical protein n=1 Tax=Chryseobacterium sp. JUb7 TaxID=2940599 RepID=UPI00216AA548|nr:hypothetical protein [Chryseobacterium sp. JUb7]MCS3529461.1 hypothetical protein [Chryseobacterium sp. JUb7]
MNPETPFPSIKSEINQWGAWLIQITLLGLLLFSFVLFFLLPIYGIYKRGITVMLWPSVICFSISFLILIPALRYYFFKRHQLAREITVTEKGLLFYNTKKEVTEKILYSELCSSGQAFDIKTVNTMNSGIIPLLEVYVQPESHEPKMIRLDMNLPLHVVNNKYELYAHFLQGISVFRPDLKIDPIVLHNYLIDKDSWKTSPNGKISWVLILGLLIFLTAIIIGIIFLTSNG